MLEVDMNTHTCQGWFTNRPKLLIACRLLALLAGSTIFWFFLVKFTDEFLSWLGV